MKKYENPKMEVKALNDENIVTSSGGVSNKMQDWQSANNGAQARVIKFERLVEVTF